MTVVVCHVTVVLEHVTVVMVTTIVGTEQGTVGQDLDLLEGNFCFDPEGRSGVVMW